MISTRGRYGLRFMIDLAQNQGRGYIPMKDVAARQGISTKYLEQILPVLTKNKLIEAVHGKGVVIDWLENLRSIPWVRYLGLPRTVLLPLRVLQMGHLHVTGRIHALPWISGKGLIMW